MYYQRKVGSCNTSDKSKYICAMNCIKIVCEAKLILEILSDISANLYYARNCNRILRNIKFYPFLAHDFIFTVSTFYFFLHHGFCEDFTHIPGFPKSPFWFRTQFISRISAAIYLADLCILT